MENRDRNADLLKVATRTLEECASYRDGDFGLDPKRPFGWSHHPCFDVLEMIGEEPPDDNGYTLQQELYARELWSEIGEFIVRTWKEKVAP